MAFEKNMGENSNSKHVNLNEDSKIIPKTISDILKNVPLVSDCSKNPSDLDSHLHSYENELRKVDAFKRELPLCMQLLKDGIEKLNEERLRCKDRDTEPIITLPINSNTEEDELAKMSIDLSEKKVWMSSFQLWSTPIQYEHQESFSSMGNQEEQLGSGLFKSNGGAFVPFKKSSTSEMTITEYDQRDVTELVDQEKVDDEKASHGLFRPQPLLPQKKKQRRCWSPQLHGIFVDALDKIGGAEVATPKRILEKMKVEGLTSDEVKSHLQKYRIHIRRRASSAANLSWLANKEVTDNDGNNNMPETVESESRGKQVDRRF